ncbi:PPE family protein [[Mycobacterium] crassicus]|uniref:PPE family protein n=1 Tax=[Mycobacterium] crassicus TaxID=2872309 RepID=A0ABU5XHT2_9MYCO|nr:PPE family protein [Mycolicibacter sp. MYC098]MEB3021733.1 PPE family protein [Mycolicibacter sp. MYC098]
MNFAALPPEVTSGWMYSGPGAAPMLSAAAAWDQLAVELGSAAADYQAVIGQLIADPWQGPAATAMTTAAAPYAQWMSTTAEQAREIAAQARAAAAAYQEAHAAVVPPPVIAANRANLQSLVATNIVGQNTPAITANQAAYGQMWAQNATAMYGYAGSSAAATTLSPLAEPPQNTDPGGQGNQAAAVGQAVAHSGSSQASNILSSMASGNPLLDFLTQINNFLANSPLYQAANFPLQTLGGAISVAGTPMFLAISPIFYVIPAIFSWFPAIVGGTPLAFTISDVSGSAMGSTLVSTAAGQAAAGGGVSAGMGRAAGIGGLSVPHTWDTPVKLASTATALPAGAGTGGLHGMPPIASVVNAPRGGAGANPRNTLRSKIVGELGGPASGGGQGTPDLVNPLTDKEREELDGLRAELTELVMEQDAVTRLMNQAFQA